MAQADTFMNVAAPDVLAQKQESGSIECDDVGVT